MLDPGAKIYRATVLNSSSASGDIDVALSSFGLQSGHISISKVGRYPFKGVWKVPDVGQQVLITGDDESLTNAFIIPSSSFDQGSIISGTGSVILGSDTSGPYVAGITGTPNQVIVTGSGGATATPVLSLPQNIHTGASPSFASIGISNSASVSNNLNVGGLVTVGGDVATYSGNVATTAASATLFNTGASVIQIGGAAEAMLVGKNTGYVTFRNDVNVLGDLSTAGSATFGATSVSSLNSSGAISASGAITTAASMSADQISTNDVYTYRVTAYESVTAGSVFASSNSIFQSNVIIQGDLLVQGTTTSADATVIDGESVFQSNAITITPIVVKGYPGQTGELQEWRNSSGDILVNIDNIGNVQFKDTRGVYPTRDTGIKWDLNGDGASIYARQGSAEALDFVFKTYDNADTNDRYLFWVDSFQGASFDKFPIVADGTAIRLGVNADGSGATDYSTTTLLVNYNGGITARGSTISVSTASNSIPLSVRGASGQTNNLTSWETSTSVPLAQITSTGSFVQLDGGVLEKDGSNNPLIRPYLADKNLLIRGSGNSGVLAYTDVTGAKPLIVRGATAHANNLQDWQVGTTTVSAIDSTGKFTGIAAQATKLENSRLIAGKTFDGSQNVVLSNLTPGAYLTGDTYSGASATTWAVNATSTSASSTVVARDASGNFAANIITAALNGNALTSSRWETARTVTFSGGDVGGSFSIRGDADVTGVQLTVNPNSIALGTDTTGNYVAALTSGTGVTISNAIGEAVSPTISIGQDVATSATPTFQRLTLTQGAGLPPLSVGTNNTKVPFLNVDLLDDKDSDYFAAQAELEALLGDLLYVGLYPAGSYTDGFVQLTAASSSYISSPNYGTIDTPVLWLDLEGTGDIDVRVKVEMNNWSNATRYTLVKKYSTTGFGFDKYDSNRLIFYMGASASVISSDIGIVEGPWHLRVTRVASTGETNFFKSEDGGKWTLISTHTLSTGTDIPITTDSVTIGPIPARVYRTTIRDGVDGNIVSDMYPSDVETRLDSQWSSSTLPTHTWSVFNGTVQAGKPVPVWSGNSTTYRNGMYWVVSSRGVLDFIDSDLSGRFDDKDDEIEVSNGDWIIALDPNFDPDNPDSVTTLDNIVFQYIPFSTETYITKQFEAHRAETGDPHGAAGYLLRSQSVVLKQFSVTERELTNNVAKLTTLTAHDFVVGQELAVSGIGEPLNGNHVITAVGNSNTTVSYEVTGSNITNGSAAGFCGIRDKQRDADVLFARIGHNHNDDIDSRVRTHNEDVNAHVRAISVTNKQLTSETATLTLISSHDAHVGDDIIVYEVGDPFDGTFAITAVTNNTISYRIPTAPNVGSTPSTGRLGLFQFLNESRADRFYSRKDHNHDSIYAKSNILDGHLQSQDPHPVYLTDTRGGALFATKVHDHDNLYYPRADIDSRLQSISSQADEVLVTDGATSARIFIGASAPTGPIVGDLWVEVDSVGLQAPTAPVLFSASPLSTSSIQLSWQAWPANAAVNALTLERQQTGASSWTPLTVAASATSFVNTGLPSNTSFTYRLRATNASASGAFGTASAATLAEVPAAPTAASASLITPTTFRLSWIPPSPVPGDFSTYEVLLNNSVFTSTTSASVSLTGLTENTTYNAGVRTRSTANLVSTAASVSVLTTNASPPAPTNLSHTSDNTTIALSWTGVSGIADFKQYNLYINSGASPVGIVTSGTSYTYTGLTAGASYSLEVQTEDSGGLKSARVSRNASTTNIVDTTPPNPPTITSFQPVTSYGRMAAVVQWPTDTTYGKMEFVNGASTNTWEGSAVAGQSTTIDSVTQFNVSYTANNTVTLRAYARDAAGNWSSASTLTYTLIASPQTIAPDASNHWRLSLFNGQWNGLGNNRIMQGYFSDSRYNARSLWFYGTKFKDQLWNSGRRTITGGRVFAMRADGIGVGAAQNIHLVNHSETTSPGTVSSNAPAPSISTPVVVGTLSTPSNNSTTSSKWLDLPAGWANDVVQGTKRGFGVHVDSGTPYLALLSVSESGGFCGAVEINHLG